MKKFILFFAALMAFGVATAQFPNIKPDTLSSSPHENGVNSPDTTPAPGPTSVQMVSKPEVAVYPNPSSDGIFKLINAAEIAQINIFGLDGKAIALQAANGEIDLQQQANGIYIAELTMKNGVRRYERLVKQ